MLVTRTATGWVPAGKPVVSSVVVAPVTSSKAPSSSRSHANVRAAPCGSEELDASSGTGVPASTAGPGSAMAATGGRGSDSISMSALACAVCPSPSVTVTVTVWTPLVRSVVSRIGVADVGSSKPALLAPSRVHA